MMNLLCIRRNGDGFFQFKNLNINTNPSKPVENKVLTGILFFKKVLFLHPEAAASPAYVGYLLLVFYGQR